MSINRELYVIVIDAQRRLVLIQARCSQRFLPYSVVTKRHWREKYAFHIGRQVLETIDSLLLRRRRKLQRCGLCLGYEKSPPTMTA